MVNKIIAICCATVMMLQLFCSVPDITDSGEQPGVANIAFRSASSVAIPECHEIRFQLHNNSKNAHVDTIIPYTARQFKAAITPGLVNIIIITRDINHVALQDVSFDKELVSGNNDIVLPVFNPANKLWDNTIAKMKFIYPKNWNEMTSVNPPLAFAIKRGGGVYPRVDITIQDNSIALDADVLKSALNLRINQRYATVSQWISRPEVKTIGGKVTVEAIYVVGDNNNLIQHFELFTSHNGKQVTVEFMVFQNAFNQNTDGIRDEINFMRDRITFY
jgi:hypothetical protein